MMRRLPARHVLLASVAILTLAGAAAAGALSSAFTQLAPSPLDKTTDPRPPAAPPEPGISVDTGPVSPSLDAVRAQGLFPFQWPWFSSTVPTPADALAGGADLAAVLQSVPQLAAFKILSAQRKSIAGEPDLQWRHAWLKVDNGQVLFVATQLVTPDLVIPAEADTIKAHARGEAAVGTEDCATHIRFIRGGRMVIVDLQCVRLADRLTLTPEDVLEIAVAIMDSYDRMS
jgi:hypothetical protein